MNPLPDPEHADPDELPPGPGYRTIAKMEGVIEDTDPERGPGVVPIVAIFKCPTGCGAIHDHNCMVVYRSYS